MNPGYRWRIEAQGDAWRWALVAHDTNEAVVMGDAPTRRVAAAMLVRAIAMGVAAPAISPRLAA